MKLSLVMALKFLRPSGEFRRVFIVFCVSGLDLLLKWSVFNPPEISHMAAARRVTVLPACPTKVE